MARQTKPVSRAGTKVPPAAAPRGKTPVAARKVPAGKPSPAAKAPPRAARQPASVRAPVQGKQELRDRIEKLERANVNLRAKNREAAEAARAAADRIDALEEEVARLRTTAPAAATPPKPGKPIAKRRGRTAASKRDPGDAVPPGVAVREPQPLDEEAKAAKHSLEEHLADA